MDREGRVRDGEKGADKETDGGGGEREFVVRSRVMMAFLAVHYVFLVFLFN